jgi:hypothetical protein
MTVDRWHWIASALPLTLFACGSGSPTEDSAAASTSSTADALQAASNGPPARDHLALWLRSDLGVTLQSSDAGPSTVSVWADQSGRGNRDATTLYAQPGPLYIPDAYGTIPALRSDGAPRALFVNAGHGYALGRASSLFVVMTPSGQAGSTVPMGGSDPLSFDLESTQGRQYSIVETPRGIEWANAVLPTTPSLAAMPDAGAGDTFFFTRSRTAGLHSFGVVQRDGVLGVGLYDGALVAVYRPKAPSVYLMSLMGGPGNAFITGNNDPMGQVLSTGLFNKDGDMLEVLQYDEALEVHAIEAVERYLKARYGL